MSFVIGLCSLLSSAVHFCPDGFTCGNIWKPATVCICILHSDDQILTDKFVETDYVHYNCCHLQCHT
jgi:hypothetical protein